MNSYSENKAIASCFYEAYNRRDLAKTFEAFVATDLVNHTMDGKLDREAWLHFDCAFLDACPDLQLTIKEQFVENNKVVTYWDCSGTHQQEFFGMPPSGNYIRLTGISIDGIQEGKIKEHFAIADFTQFMQQFAKR